MMDASACYTDAIYRLGFASGAEVTSTSWVTAAELYQWADELARRLSYQTGLFLTYDGSVSVSAGTAAYALPATHLFTAAAALITASGLQLLRLTSVGELFALDGAWSATTGPATRISMDAGGLGTATLYPNPTVPGTLGLICSEAPAAAITSGAPTVSIPTVLQDMVTYAMLKGARGKESDDAMPDMAAHFEERLKLYEAVARHLWGGGTGE